MALFLYNCFWTSAKNYFLKAQLDPMRFVYVFDVLSLWSKELLQLVRMVLYPPPTATVAKSTFSFQKWFIGSRRTSMKPATCNKRIVGRSILALKRRMAEAKTEKSSKRIKL